MKLDEKIITQGVFSIGDSENYNLAGALEVSDSGEMFLDCILHPDYSLSDGGFINLTGKTSELGKILLIDSFTVLSRLKSLGSFAREKFLCNKMVCVEEDHRGYEVKTSKMTFEIEDLEKWIDKPIVNHEWKDNKSTYSYDLPKPEFIDLGDGLTLRLSYVMSISTGNFSERTEVKSKALAIFETSEDKSIDFFIDQGITLSNLVSFALESVCTIKDSYYGEDKNNKVIFRTSNKVEKRKEINLLNYFFTMRLVGDKSKEIIKNWFLLAPKLRPTISLYNQFKSNFYVYSEAEFIALAQAAEALHRRTCDTTPMPKKNYSAMINDIIDKAGEEHADFLRSKLSFGNEYSFRKRLELMLSICWSDEKIIENEKTIKNIVNVRNLFTHNPSRADRELNASLANKLFVYKDLLENIIISNILYLLSSNDKDWTVLMMNRINRLRRVSF